MIASKARLALNQSMRLRSSPRQQEVGVCTYLDHSYASVIPDSPQVTCGLYTNPSCPPRPAIKLIIKQQPVKRITRQSSRWVSYTAATGPRGGGVCSNKQVNLTNINSSTACASVCLTRPACHVSFSPSILCCGCGILCCDCTSLHHSDTDYVHCNTQGHIDLSDYNSEAPKVLTSTDDLDVVYEVRDCNVKQQPSESMSYLHKGSRVNVTVNSDDKREITDGNNNIRQNNTTVSKRPTDVHRYHTTVIEPVVIQPRQNNTTANKGMITEEHRYQTTVEPVVIEPTVIQPEDPGFQPGSVCEVCEQPVATVKSKPKVCITVKRQRKKYVSILKGRVTKNKRGRKQRLAHDLVPLGNTYKGSVGTAKNKVTVVKNEKSPTDTIRDFKTDQKCSENTSVWTPEFEALILQELAGAQCDKKQGNVDKEPSGVELNSSQNINTFHKASVNHLPSFNTPSHQTHSINSTSHIGPRNTDIYPCCLAVKKCKRHHRPRSGHGRPSKRKCVSIYSHLNGAANIKTVSELQHRSDNSHSTDTSTQPLQSCQVVIVGCDLKNKQFQNTLGKLIPKKPRSLTNSTTNSDLMSLLSSRRKPVTSAEEALVKRSEGRVPYPLPPVIMCPKVSSDH